MDIKHRKPKKKKSSEHSHLVLQLAPLLFLLYYGWCINKTFNLWRRGRINLIIIYRAFSWTKMLAGFPCWAKQTHLFSNHCFHGFFCRSHDIDEILLIGATQCIHISLAHFSINIELSDTKLYTFLFIIVRVKWNINLRLSII